MARYLVLESKGDRVKILDGDYGINRPAYNEMVGSLSAFILANFRRIANEHETHAFGWLYTVTFLTREIEAFSASLENLPYILPIDSGFTLGLFRSDKFWKIAPRELRKLAQAWFAGPEQMRNQLLRELMSKPSTVIDEELVAELFEFDWVNGSRK